MDLYFVDYYILTCRINNEYHLTKMVFISNLNTSETLNGNIMLVRLNLYQLVGNIDPIARPTRSKAIVENKSIITAKVKLDEFNQTKLIHISFP